MTFLSKIPISLSTPAIMIQSPNPAAPVEDPTLVFAHLDVPKQTGPRSKRRASFGWIQRISASGSSKDLLEVASQAKKTTRRVFSNTFNMRSPTKSQEEEKSSPAEAVPDPAEQCSDTETSSDDTPPSSFPGTPTDGPANGFDPWISDTSLDSQRASKELRLKLSPSTESLIRAFIKTKAVLETIFTSPIRSPKRPKLKDDQSSDRYPFPLIVSAPKNSGVDSATMSSVGEVLDGPRRPAFKQSEPYKIHHQSYVEEVPSSDSFSETFVLLLSSAACLACFPLWFSYIGGCIALAPSYIDKLPIGPTPISNSKLGLERLKYWLRHLEYHLLAFTSLVTFICWKTGTLHLLILIPIWSCYVWADFKVDEDFVMGTDDRQTVYVVLLYNRRYRAVCEAAGMLKGIVVGGWEKARPRVRVSEEEMGYFRIGF